MAFTPHFPAPLSGAERFEGGILRNFLSTSQWYHCPSVPHLFLTIPQDPPFLEWCWHHHAVGYTTGVAVPGDRRGGPGRGTLGCRDDSCFVMRPTRVSIGFRIHSKNPHFGGADIYRTGYPLLQAGGGGHNVCRGRCTYGLADGVSGSHAARPGVVPEGSKGSKDQPAPILQALAKEHKI